jgi:hypothetical protein
VSKKSSTRGAEMATNRFEERVAWAVENLTPHTYPDEIVRRCLQGLLIDLRRGIAGDGPSDRPPGALEHFDKICDQLGVPFLKP